MDPKTFAKDINDSAALFVAKLYNLSDLPRRRVSTITRDASLILQHPSTELLFNQILNRLRQLGESPNNISAYTTMLHTLQNPFNLFNSESQCFDYFKSSQTYIPPVEVKIGEKFIYKTKNDHTAIDIENLTVQIVPLRNVLTKFFQLPNIFDDTIEYLNKLEKETKIISNVTQCTIWKRKKVSFGDRLVLPIFFYQDDYETNNPLGSHKGLGKMGTIYIIIPCLPPHLLSKVENIFLLALYKTEDLKHVPLAAVLNDAVKELKYLESTGITINTLSGPKQIYFSLAGVIGDNLAIHTVLGFVGSFSSHYPCRFCYIKREEINTTFNESTCTLRTSASYDEDVKINAPSQTGVARQSALHDIPSSTTIDLLTVDAMHDIFEGVCEYDLGLLMNYFIVTAKLFDLDKVNERIESLFYGDESRNKPRPLKKAQIIEKYIKMSAAESLCFIRNVGVLIGHLIPENNRHWKLCILLKEIVDIVTSPIIHSDICDYLENLISEYLRLLASLFPGCLKPKHHFLIHYSRIMLLMGPIWHMNTMRSESKNKESKIAARVAVSRRNIAKTVAIKHQLHLSYRFLQNANVDQYSYERSESDQILIDNLPDFRSFSSCLKHNLQGHVTELNFIKYKARTIKKNTILMSASEKGPQFYLVHVLFEDNVQTLVVVVKDITMFTYYDEHFQAYKITENIFVNISTWKVFNLKDLEHCHITHYSYSGHGEKYILKRWI